MKVNYYQIWINIDKTSDNNDSEAQKSPSGPEKKINNW